MSYHVVAGIDFPKRLPTATAPYFLLGLNAAGHWVIRETTGRKAGLFRTREGAIKYVRDESAGERGEAQCRLVERPADSFHRRARTFRPADLLIPNDLSECALEQYVAAKFAGFARPGRGIRRLDARHRQTQGSRPIAEKPRG